MLAFVGFSIVFLMIFSILRGKASPLVCFILLPTIGALVAGFSISEVSEFISAGVGTTWKTAVLFIFSISFFGIMTDVGLFDRLVDKLIKIAGNNVILIYVVTVLIAIVGHLDGASATTYLITIPAMLPLYRKLKLNPLNLLLLCGSATGILNLVPWGGPVIRAATAIGGDPSELWRALIPMQILGIIVAILLAVLLAKKEMKTNSQIAKSTIIVNEEFAASNDESSLILKRPKLFFANLFLTICVIITLVLDVIPSFAVFMIGVCVAFIVNYRDPKLQQERLKVYAPNAIILSATLLGAGILLGILTNSGMMEAMAKTMISVMPSFLTPYLHIIIGIFAAPIGMAIGPDPYFYGILPLVGEMVGSYGVTLKSTALAMLIGENVALSISPVVPTTFLAIGLAGVDLKDHIKYSLKWLWGISVIMLIAGVIIGII